MAVVMEGNNAGLAEAQITVQKTICCIPNFPSFVYFTDLVGCSLVVNNQVEETQEVCVWATSVGAEICKVQGWKLNLKAKQSAEVFLWFRFNVPGHATLKIYAANHESLLDKQEIKVPVLLPRLSDPFVFHNSFDAHSLFQPVQVPIESLIEFNNFNVSLSTTPDHFLMEALQFIVESPYNTTEQIATRIVAVLSLQEFLSPRASLSLPSKKRLLKGVVKDLHVLSFRQLLDGGFDWFENKDPTVPGNPFLTSHVCYAMNMCRVNSIPVPLKMEKKISEYFQKIKNLEDVSVWTAPFCWRQTSKLFMYAYSLFARSPLNDIAVIKEAANMLKYILRSETDMRVSLETFALLLLVILPMENDGMKEELLQLIVDNISDDGTVAYVSDNYPDDDGERVLIASPCRSTGIVLSVLLDLIPTDPVIYKLVNGLNSMKGTNGHWGSSQANCFALMALCKFYKKYMGDDDRTFSLSVWFNQHKIGMVSLHGNSCSSNELAVPFCWTNTALLRSSKRKKEKEAILITKEGMGHIYYKLCLDYLPKNLTFPPNSGGDPPNTDGFDGSVVVSRNYSLLEGEKSVQVMGDRLSVLLGAIILVTLMVTNSYHRYHCVLVDPLPTTFKPLHSLYQPENCWYTNEKLGRERVEIYAVELGSGNHSYTYVVQTTVPGTFLVPPCKLVDIYSPHLCESSPSHKISVTELNLPSPSSITTSNDSVTSLTTSGTSSGTLDTANIGTTNTTINTGTNDTTLTTTTAVDTTIDTGGCNCGSGNAGSGFDVGVNPPTPPIPITTPTTTTTTTIT
eukprot:TRINITY_DN10054_c0_g1_i1.p1 TRINITY_DN10054_c0_g1~~TRINITY_DN10054_c0_g1_i1.p1  ORF type:complete len:794 (+),score=172.24 TRINITY_DN10054_c0_g1_i1:784-3165(+)